MKKLTLKSNLATVLRQVPLVIGVSPSAWPRIVPAFFLDKYRIICLKDRPENEILRHRGVTVFSLRETGPETEVETLSATNILKAEPVKKYLSAINEPFALLVYKTTKPLEALAAENGWRLLAAPYQVKAAFEDKRIFKETIRKLGLTSIPGQSMPVEELDEARFEAFQREFGQAKLVLQLAEVTYGGGSGTLFVEKTADLALFREMVVRVRERLEGKKKRIETVNVAPFITGPSPSMACCATRHGVLTGPLQTQILDIAAVGTLKKGRSGNYAGHDWSFRHYPPEIQAQAEKIARGFGEYLYSQGYRGIFGLDFLVEETSGKVYPVECNPRFTDAFPTISLFFIHQGLVPMEVFHLLELLDIDYEMDFEAINRGYKREIEGAQMILHNRLGGEAVTGGVIGAGVHRYDGAKLEFLRPGLTPLDLAGPDEFLLTEGVPGEPGEELKETGRICRLIGKMGFLAEGGGLKPEIAGLVERVYGELKLKPLSNERNN